jgi:hypothetical protein
MVARRKRTVDLLMGMKISYHQWLYYQASLCHVSRSQAGNSAEAKRAWLRSGFEALGQTQPGQQNFFHKSIEIAACKKKAGQAGGIARL